MSDKTLSPKDALRRVLGGLQNGDRMLWAREIEVLESALSHAEGELRPVGHFYNRPQEGRIGVEWCCDHLDDGQAIYAHPAPQVAVPEGYIIVRREWGPIMAEIDRRAEKMWDATQDFQVTIEGDLYQELAEAENIPVAAAPTHKQEESQ